jgi:uncharacterized protein YjeT (DUF2065 family)
MSVLADKGLAWRQMKRYADQVYLLSPGQLRILGRNALLAALDGPPGVGST